MRVRAGNAITVSTSSRVIYVSFEFELLANSGLRIAPISRKAFRRAAGMVRRHDHGFQVGNSLHLAVALELGASHMATLDGKLAANVKRHGMELIEF